MFFFKGCWWSLLCIYDTNCTVYMSDIHVELTLLQGCVKGVCVCFPNIPHKVCYRVWYKPMANNTTSVIYRDANLPPNGGNPLFWHQNIDSWDSSKSEEIISDSMGEGSLKLLTGNGNSPSRVNLPVVPLFLWLPVGIPGYRSGRITWVCQRCEYYFQRILMPAITYI